MTIVLSMNQTAGTALSADVAIGAMSAQSARSWTPRSSAGLEGLAIAVTGAVTWGVAIRDGYDELYDPSHHRDLTGHAYLTGSEQAALCGYRPPTRNFFARQRVKLGMMTPGVHGRCEKCETVFTPSVRADDLVRSHRSKVPVPIRFALTAFR
jgi:hypothetical protein